MKVCDDAARVSPARDGCLPGYDHITSARDGGARSARRCSLRHAEEHVGPPARRTSIGRIAYKIAAHAGDIARGIVAARQWDDDMSRARAALNWPKQFEIAFDGETARALHDEDLDVDTDFCAMCGHDWCSMRISKEIQDFASGKAEGFQPVKRAAKSPGLTQEQTEFLAHRGTKHVCHSDNVADVEEARRVQNEYVRLRVEK